MPTYDALYFFAVRPLIGSLGGGAMCYQMAQDFYPMYSSVGTVIARRINKGLTN